MGGFVVLMIPTIMNFNRDPPSSKIPVGKDHGPHMLPGMVVAPDPDRPKPPHEEKVVDVPKEQKSGKVADSYANIDIGPKDANDPSARFRNLPRDRDWQDYEVMKKDKVRTGQGEQGKPVVLPRDTETQKLEDQIYRVNGFDGLVSDQISLNRSIKDIRHPECKNLKYLQKLPTVTVILPFHNEASLCTSGYSSFSACVGS